MKFIFISFILFPLSVQSQILLPAIEPVLGINYYKSANTYDDSYYYSGVAFYYGLRGQCFIGNRVAVAIGGGAKSYPYNGDFFMSASIKGYVYRDYQTGFSVFCELGGEASGWGGLSLPLIVGTNQYMGESISFNFRLRIPTILDVKRFDYSSQYEVGIEAGLQFDLTRKNKKITRYGNPFILL